MLVRAVRLVGGGSQGADMKVPAFATLWAEAAALPPDKTVAYGLRNLAGFVVPHANESGHKDAGHVYGQSQCDQIDRPEPDVERRE